MIDSVSDARQKLDEAMGVRRQLASVSQCSWWEQLLQGLAVGAIVLAMDMSIPVMYALEGFSFALFIFLYWRMRTRHGYFVNNYRKGRTRKVVLLALCGIFALMGVSTSAHFGLLPDWAAWVAAIVAIGGTIVKGRSWHRVYDAELRDGF